MRGAAPCASSSHSVGSGDQFAVAVAFGDVGNDDRGQGAGGMQLLAAAFQPAFVAQFAQHALERGAVIVLEVEGAGDFARADLAGLLADEGEKLVLGGKLRAFLAWSFGQGDIGSEEFRSLYLGELGRF